jgi:hypothetical protein
MLLDITAETLRWLGFSLAQWAGPGRQKPGLTVFTAIPLPAQVARLVAGSLQALGPAAPMAQTWNQYWVPLVRPVTVQLEALPT